MGRKLSEDRRKWLKLEHYDVSVSVSCHLSVHSVKLDFLASLICEDTAERTLGNVVSSVPILVDLLSSVFINLPWVDQKLPIVSTT